MNTVSNSYVNLSPAKSQSNPILPHAFLPDRCATTHHQRTLAARTPITPPPTHHAVSPLQPYITAPSTDSALHSLASPRYATAHATAAATSITAACTSSDHAVLPCADGLSCAKAYANTKDDYD
jgi:hypothetical protein